MSESNIELSSKEIQNLIKFINDLGINFKITTSSKSGIGISKLVEIEFKDYQLENEEFDWNLHKNGFVWKDGKSLFKRDITDYDTW